MSEYLRVPPDYDLMAFFESEPISRMPEVGFWAYRFTDSGGTSLEFAFNILEQWVRAEMFLDERKIFSMTRDGATVLTLIEGRLSCEFETRGEKGLLKVWLTPHVRIVSESLRTGW